MKKFLFYVAMAVVSVATLTFTSCKGTEGGSTTTDLTAPVYGTDFTITVTDNSVEFNCSMSGVTSYLWQVYSDSTGTTMMTKSTDNPFTTTISNAGTYSVKLGVSNGGDMVYSDVTTFEITTTDLSFADGSAWKQLTGGSAATNGKTWKLDITDQVTTTIDDAGNVTSTTSHVSQYFHNPLDFYGDATVGGSDTNIWGPWGGTNLYGWGSKPENGTINFKAEGLVATLVLNGTTYEGNYTFTPEDRDPDFLTLTDGTSLWDNMTGGQYSYLQNTEYADSGFNGLSPKMGWLVFSNNDSLRFPMDSGRIADDEFAAEDLQQVLIMHVSDSALVVRIKRSTEGGSDSKCYLLYNYIVDGYDYGLATSYTHAGLVNTTGTTSTLNGTYKFAEVPGGWFGWSADAWLNDWTTREAYLAELSSWSVDTTGSHAALNDFYAYFDGSGNCTIHDYSASDSAYAAVSTTYSVSGGYVTFGTDVTITASTVALSGTNMYMLTPGSDAPSTSGSVWLGQNNGDKSETVAVQLVKQ